MISKDEILKRGAVEVHAKVGGIRQRHTLKVQMEKTAWGSVPFCVSSFQLPVSELIRIAKEIGLPVKCKGMSVFPPGKAAQDFAMTKIEKQFLSDVVMRERSDRNYNTIKEKESHHGKETAREKNQPDDEKKKPEKKKRLAHNSVLGSESGVLEETKDEEKPKDNEEQKDKEEDDELDKTQKESEEDCLDAKEKPEKEKKCEADDEKDENKKKKNEATNSFEGILIPEPDFKAAEDAVGPIIEIDTAISHVQIESQGNGKNIESDQFGSQKEKDDKEKKKFASDVLSEGILR